MANGYVLVNKKSGNGNYAQELSALQARYTEPLQILDVMQITDYKSFFEVLEPDDFVIIAGGDGTLNHFINDTAGLTLPERVLCFPIGSGNDFARELGKSYGCDPFPIEKYLKKLPSVEVNGTKYRFLNGVGYGIDGYCTEEGDKLRAQGKRDINYTSIAIKGLLFHFKPRNAKVTVDGKEYTYNKVWIAPTMHGKCYGGGMYPTPDQDRSAEDPVLSTMLFHGHGKLRTLMIFPSLFKGEHVKHTESVQILTGKDITVEFDRPTPLQIDGETIKNVTSYHACAYSEARTEQEAVCGAV